MRTRLLAAGVLTAVATTIVPLSPAVAKPATPAVARVVKDQVAILKAKLHARLAKVEARAGDHAVYVTEANRIAAAIDAATTKRQLRRINPAISRFHSAVVRNQGLTAAADELLAAADAADLAAAEAVSAYPDDVDVAAAAADVATVTEAVRTGVHAVVAQLPTLDRRLLATLGDQLEQLAADLDAVVVALTAAVEAAAAEPEPEPEPTV